MAKFFWTITKINVEIFAITIIVVVSLYAVLVSGDISAALPSIEPAYQYLG